MIFMNIYTSGESWGAKLQKKRTEDFSSPYHLDNIGVGLYIGIGIQPIKSLPS